MLAARVLAIRVAHQQMIECAEATPPLEPPPESDGSPGSDGYDRYDRHRSGSRDSWDGFLYPSDDEGVFDDLSGW